MVKWEWTLFFDSSFTSNMWVFIHFFLNWLSFLLQLVQIDLYIQTNHLLFMLLEEYIEVYIMIHIIDCLPWSKEYWLRKQVEEMVSMKNRDTHK